MRHHDRNRKLGREKRQRVALLRGLARSLILHEGITTTEAKAKALRPFVERLVTAAKSDSLSGTRRVATRLAGEEARGKLKELAKRYKKRTGGYTRITRLQRVGKRVGSMSRIEFISAEGGSSSGGK
ncbi:50S ribosomal protein L17 [Candidatus Kaiserbacteria bacterium]|nr:50S ribosomal protein L17 [Candidatus Kaiserbacteria bacterium]